MKRKSKKHEPKVSPEKSPEKPSRRSARHSRRKRKSSSSSSSPERESLAKSKEVPRVKDSPAKTVEKVRSFTPELVVEKNNKEVIETEAGTRRRICRRQPGNELASATTALEKNRNAPAQDSTYLVKKDGKSGGDGLSEWKEDRSFWEGGNKVEEPIENKEQDTGSVWKVQSANGSGGEIQKLKICRQRMTDSQSQDESPTSPKRRSSRNKDSKTDETSDNEADIKNEKSCKLKIKTRTSSSRSSPAVIDSPKVVCDVSEDNPTKIKIHIENKSPVTSPSLPQKDEIVNQEVITDSNTISEIELPITKEPISDSNKKDNKIVQQNKVVEEVEINTSISDNIELKEMKTSEQPTSIVTTEAIVEQAVETIEPNYQENKAEYSQEIVVDQEESNEKSLNSSPRQKPVEHTNSAFCGSSSEDSDSDDVRRKNKRMSEVHSTVTCLPDQSTKEKLPVFEDPTREESGQQESEEEGQLPEEEPVEEIKKPIPSDKENADVITPKTTIVVEPVQRKRRWGASKTIRPAKKPVLCISTDSLKNLIPEAKPLPIEEVRLSADESGDKESDKEDDKIAENMMIREKSPERVKLKKQKKEIKEVKKEKEKDKRERNKSSTEVKEIKDTKEVRRSSESKRELKLKTEKSALLTDQVNRRICVVSDDIKKFVKSPSPSKRRPSKVLFITNLVRPFTIPQLRNLLARTGKIAENGFWIDKIKSKCYVEYTDEEAAIETRHALHGVRWPVNNPHTLSVQFASSNDMAVAQALSEESDPIPRKSEPLKVEPVDIIPNRRVVREWDVGKPAHPDERLAYDNFKDHPKKEHDRERERDHDKERRFKKDIRRSSRSPPEDPPVRKARRKAEEAPAKLLDDLFRKTKTSPCIYWLPLTSEQIVVKEEIRRQHMAEHERRVAEMKKADLARRDRERRRK